MTDLPFPKALTLAGFDGSGGAGIQADLKTFAALRCHGLSVLTALPVQNGLGVRSIYPIPLSCIEQQLDLLLSEPSVKACKVGMLHRAEVIEVVADRLTRYRPLHLIVDPVMVASAGGELLQSSAISTLIHTLLPITTLLTPNLQEATCLLRRPIFTRDEMEQAAYDLLQLGCQAVLLKGGHLQGSWSPDLLLIRGTGPIWAEHARIDTLNTHGTGCTLSAAITARLAHGDSLQPAVATAQRYLQGCLVAGHHWVWGEGHGPVHHFYELWAPIEKTNKETRYAN